MAPRTPRGQPMGKSNQLQARIPEKVADGSQSARGPPRLAALERVRQESAPRPLSSRVPGSAGSQQPQGASRLTPIGHLGLPEHKRQTQVPLEGHYPPKPSAMRAQDIIPFYERSNPTMVKLNDIYRQLASADNKRELERAFCDHDPKQCGEITRSAFAEGIKAVDRKLSLNIPRVLFDDMYEEACAMFGVPEQASAEPQDVVHYQKFIDALQRPPSEFCSSLQEAMEASSPARRMQPTSQLLQRSRQSQDFSILERMKVHVIQNDLRSLLALRRGLDPGKGPRDCFLRLDRDRDGVIGKEDLRWVAMELGMPMSDESLELTLSYCVADQIKHKGGIDFMSFVKNFEACGIGSFNPYNPNKRLPSPPFRAKADRCSPAFGKESPPGKATRKETAKRELLMPDDAGYVQRGLQLQPNPDKIEQSAQERRRRTEQRRAEARRNFNDYEQARRAQIENEHLTSPPRKKIPVLHLDTGALVAADVQRQRDAMKNTYCA